MAGLVCAVPFIRTGSAFVKRHFFGSRARGRVAERASAKSPAKQRASGTSGAAQVEQLAAAYRLWSVYLAQRARAEGGRRADNEPRQSGACRGLSLDLFASPVRRPRSVGTAALSS